MDVSKDPATENTERIGLHSPLCYLVVAGVAMLFLSSCFITKCVVSYHLFSQNCEEVKNQSNFNNFFKNFSCFPDPADTMVWTASLKNCEEMGGNLAVINTQEEQNFLFHAKPSRREFFIGLTDREVDGQWQWVDNTPFNKTLSFWDIGEPNNIATVEDCVTIRDSSNENRNWNDVTCFFNYYRICEKPVRRFLTEKKQ
ncbi:C-type lectin domain family 4 member E isoform X2 [Macrotis lagotis]|uniref:C-type lectin domain family 4 member E isoform X2 n=1 Tax=Macrotis lagotis TaxID=92651 RepID=UPI003D684053